MMTLFRWILKFFPWGIRNLGRYRTWSETDWHGDSWTCYRFLKDCDCPGKNGEEKHFLSGPFRPRGTLKIQPTAVRFWGPSPWFNAELDGWGWALYEDCPMTVPRAIQAIVFHRIEHLMWDVVEHGRVLDAEECWLVNQEIAFAVQEKRKQAEKKAKQDAWCAARGIK